MSTIAAGAASRSPVSLALLVATTAAVFYAAYVYAHAVGDSIRSGTRLRLASLGDLARREITILLAAVFPSRRSCSAPSGWIERSTATWLTAGVNVLLGLVVAALNVSLGH